MRFIVGIIVFVASLGAIAVTMTMNASYQYGQGATPREAVMRAVAMAVFDCVKAGLPVGMAFWWLRRQWLLLGLSGAVFVFCFVMSLVSAVGFYATNRVAVTQDREGVTITYRDARKELEGIERQLSDTGSARPVSVVEAALRGLKTDRRFANSKECVDLAGASVRDFCRGYFAVEGELATAREVHRLEGRREDLRLTLQRLIKAGAEREADPQAQILKRLLPFLHLQDVKLSVDLLPSLLLELVAGFGLLFASSMMQWSGQKEWKQRTPDVLDACERASAIEAGVQVRPLSFAVTKDGSYAIVG